MNGAHFKNLKSETALAANHDENALILFFDICAHFMYPNCHKPSKHVGLIGNTWGLAYFSIGRKYKRAFELFMACLAVCDNTFIIIAILAYAVPEYLDYVEIDSTEYSAYLIPWLVPIAQVATSCNILFTIAISHERYKVICTPLKHRAAGGAKSSWIYVLRIIAFSLIYNASKFFELKTVFLDDENQGNDISNGVGQIHLISFVVEMFMCRAFKNIS